MRSEVRKIRPARTRKIVVGVTRDEAARSAFRWALHRATVEDAVLVVVTAYSPPRVALNTYCGGYIDPRDTEATARFVQEDVLLGELHTEAPDARIQRVVVPGRPVGVLVAAASDADLLVLGRRTNRLGRLVTRSISTGCENRARCPVVVVRGDLRGASASGLSFVGPLAPVDVARCDWSARQVEQHVPRERRHRQFELRRDGS